MCHQELDLFFQNLPLPTEPVVAGIDHIIERLPQDDDRWWDKERLERFVSSLAPITWNGLND